MPDLLNAQGAPAETNANLNEDVLVTLNDAEMADATAGSASAVATAPGNPSNSVNLPPRKSSDRPKGGASKAAKGGAPAGKPGRELPEELRGSEEAVAVWNAAKLASFDCREQSVHGWQITWRPRATAGKGRAGDMYIFPPRDSFSAGIGSVRSLSNLRDALLSRKAARDDPSSVLFHPPAPGSLVEVRLAGAEPDANGASEEPVWRQAQVLLVSPDRSFQVAVHTEGCDPPLAHYDAHPALDAS